MALYQLFSSTYTIIAVDADIWKSIWQMEELCCLLVYVQIVNNNINGNKDGNGVKSI